MWPNPYFGVTYDGADYWGQGGSLNPTGSFWPNPYFGVTYDGIDYWGQDGAVTPFIAYVSPQAATLLPDDSAISDVAPEKAAILF